MLESARVDRLFDDPLAAEFVAAAGWHHPEDDHLGDQWVSVRTRFFDDHLLRAVDGACRQMVNIGAGLDARAFRLRWPAPVTIFEIDLPQMLAFKDSVIANHKTDVACMRVALPANLTQEWEEALLRNGFDPDVPTAFLVEGVLTYLSATDVDRLMRGIGRYAAPGSRLALTAATASMIAEHGGRGWAIGDEPHHWLAEYGWAGEVFEAEECARHYGRTMADEKAVGKLITADRRP
jgi:methyltransferase (TIGR00027 family)